MKRYRIVIVVGLLTAAVYAQKVAEIVEQLSAPRAAAPVAAEEPVVPVAQPEAAVEPQIGMTVSLPMESIKPVETSAAPVDEIFVLLPAESPAGSAPVPDTPDVSAAETVPAAVVISEPVASDEVIQAVDSTSGQDASAMIKGGLISLSLKEVELSSVIRIFATLSEANIIIPDLGAEAGVAKVDVNLRDVEWRPALQAILDSHDLELFEKIPGSQVYSVRRKPADAPAALNVKTFRLNYATVTGVSDMLRSMIPEPGKISLFPARNTIVVQTTPENMAEVEYMISAVDFPRQQVFIEAKFLELTDRASEQLGIDWQVLGGYRVGVDGIRGSYGYQDSKVDGIDRSFGTGANRYTDIAGRRFEKIDEKPEVPILDPLGNLVNNIDYPARPGSFGPDDSRTYGLIPTTLQETLNSVTSVDASTVSRTLGATLSASEFNLVLAALREIGGTKVVSNPKIIVANEQTAQIHIGRIKPKLESTSQAVNENQTQVTTKEVGEYKDGISVDVTPTINTASNITVKITPTLDRLDVEPFTSKDGNQYYGKTTKKIDTLFSLASGQTAAIGGLTQTDADEVERKVPLLGSLPLIGRFFSYSSKVNEQRETVIFVTVGLANPENIDMETGLPQNSSLAMRYEIQARTDRQVQAEKLKFLETQENERAQKELRVLREAELERLLKKAEDKTPDGDGI